MVDARSKTDASAAPPVVGFLRPGHRLGLLLFVVVLAVLLFMVLRNQVSLERLAAGESELRQWRADYPVATIAAAGILYVVVTGMSLPVATALTLGCAWYFGFWHALILVSFASTAGAVVAFLMSRYLLRDWVEQLAGDRLSRLHDAFEREGAFYLFTLRLVPAVPFLLVNTGMGLTRIDVGTFWWVSQIGMLPGTAAYVYAGASVPSLQQLADEGAGQVLNGRMLVAFAVLGLLPLVMRRIVASVRGTKEQ